MFRLLQTTFNICRLSITLLKLKFSKKVNTKLSKTLVNDIMRCGSVTIKFGQWFATKHDISSMETRPIYTELQRTLENCPEHDMRHTREVFKTSFGKDISEVLELYDTKPIASGSVGQVYKGLMGDIEVVMKVMHPNITADYMVTAFFLRFIGTFIGRIDMEEFLRNVKAQYDYNNEANNLLTMYNFYKEDNVIIIPKLIMHSKNVIIMTYEDGIDYNEVHQEVLKQKVALSILSFQRQNSSIFGCIHGDLHDGNWKVRMVDDTFKLVIYDFGLVNKVDPVVMEKWVKAFQYQDFVMLVDIALSHSEGNFDPEIRDLIVYNCKTLIHPKSGMLKTLKVIIPVMRKYKIKIRDNFLSILVSFALTENILSNLDRGTICIDTHNGYVSNCLDIIAFCESWGTCRLLQNQLEKDIKDIRLTKMFTRSDSILDACSLDDFYNDNINSELN